MKTQTQTQTQAIQETMEKTGWFKEPGAYVLFDGQFGSTGKGLLAGLIGELFCDKMDRITTNAGPNSGHTAYVGGEKVVTRQIPIAAVCAERSDKPCDPWVDINAGGVVDMNVLTEELALIPETAFSVSPYAACIKPEHLGQNQDIASTGKGVGPAMADKIMRKEDAAFYHLVKEDQAKRGIKEDSLFYIMGEPSPHFDNLGSMNQRVFIETAQGFSLGINQGFYPHTTSRDCGVAQALNDAQIAPKHLRKSIVSLRTFPIRVGDVPEGTSGGWYHDQKETTFEELGVEPEFTTVTGRQRRVATWSWSQFREMLLTNAPDALFLNFANYLSEGDWRGLAFECEKVYAEVLGHAPDFTLIGHGPRPEDVELFDGVPF